MSLMIEYLPPNDMAKINDGVTREGGVNKNQRAQELLNSHEFGNSYIFPRNSVRLSNIPEDRARIDLSNRFDPLGENSDDSVL